jgi:hypothetical protein
MRRNLVIVRASENSLHPEWLTPVQHDRSWDIIVSAFGNGIGKYTSPDLPSLDGNGPKLPALYRLLAPHIDSIVKQYDYIWLPDDDIRCTCGDIDRFFALCRQFKLALAQPSLTATSFISHPITMHNPHYLVRFTNYVESMVICIRNDIFMPCFRTFSENTTGWGLDYLWATMAQGRSERIGIVDAVQVKHTRAFGGPNYDYLSSSRLTYGKQLYLAYLELVTVFDKHSINLPFLECHGAVDQNGEQLSSEEFQRQKSRWFTAPL